MLSELIYVAGAFLILKLILYYLLPLAYTSYVFFLSKTIDFKKYGEWAVVTGATYWIIIELACRIFILDSFSQEYDLNALVPEYPLNRGSEKNPPMEPIFTMIPLFRSNIRGNTI